MSAMDESEVMDRRKFFIAAMEGNIGFFEEARNKEIENCDEVYFLRQTSSLKYNILHIAIKYRQYDFIQKVFVEGLLPPAVTEKLINQQDSEGNTPLHAAAEEGHIVALELLLEYGKVTTKLLDWSVKNNDGNTPLHVALMNRKVEAAEWLVKQHPEVAGETNNDGNTSLHVAAEVGAMSIFMNHLHRGSPLEPKWRVQNNEGNTLLHVALINYRWDQMFANFLILAPDLARLTNNAKETPLHLAIIKSSNFVLSRYMASKKGRTLGILMQPDLANAAEKGDVGYLVEAQKREVENEMYFLGQNSSGDNILHIAIRSGHYEFIEQVTKKMLPTSVIDKLINQSNSNYDTLFHIASEVGNLPIMELLLEFDKTGQNDVRNLNGNRPGDCGICTGNFHLANIFSSIPRYKNEGIEAIGMLIVITDRDVQCWHDEGGMTPLHRAAFLNSSLNLIVIERILQFCPESADVVDKTFGNTVLHSMIFRISTYQQGKKLLQIQGIARLISVTNCHGNTPLNLAWHFNYKMVRLLLSFQDSASFITQIQQLGVDYEQMRKNKKTLEEYGIFDGANIPFLKAKIKKFGINILFSRDSKRRNVLHNLMCLERRTPIVYGEYLQLILHVIDTYPKLLCQTDINGDTPIHIFMQNSHDTKIHPYRRTTNCLNNNDNDDNVTYTLLSKSILPLILIAWSGAYSTVAGERKEGCQFKYDSPLLVQNVEGNTPLHDALKSNHILAVAGIISIPEFVKDLRETSGLTNKRRETPLHLLAGNSLVEWTEAVIIGTHGKNEKAATSQDQDGLTPILRAVQAGNIQTVKTLNDLNKESSKIVDNNGQTLWHMLVNQPSSKTEEFVYVFGKTKHLVDLLKNQDKEGKTPLHLALESRRFTHARLFLECSYNDCSSKERMKWMTELLEIKDGDGITSGDRLASIPDLPQDLENLLTSENPIEMMGYRSVYGISMAEMKDYVSMMGVIAALLTTITFTAAFTVPGGAVQDDKDKHAVGTPILVNAVSFQAFMFFDILTMCLSTMVLFCLLWILATGSKRKSVILMDFSILLLLISFYTTLLSFMSGVYTTTIHVKPWIAIYTLVVCSSLMLLMQKYLVIKFLGPMGPIVTSMFGYLGKKVKDNACKYFGYLGSLKLCKKVKDMVCYASNESSALDSPHHQGPSE